MNTQIQIIADKRIDESLVAHVRRWANEVLERSKLLSMPSSLSITLWKSTEELNDFYLRENEALGVVTVEETDFLATHEAWRGYPRIHICQERLREIPDAIVQGVGHHEISHALHHGTQEFYTFRFSNRLQEAGRSCSMDLSILQQCVYLLSVAIKDNEVVKWLTEIGLGFGQLTLIEHLISDTQEERQAWEIAQDSPALRKIIMSAFFKLLFPIESMISVGMEEAQTIKEQWSEAYFWLPEKERKALFQFAKRTLKYKEKTFQESLERVTLALITEPSL